MDQPTLKKMRFLFECFERIGIDASPEQVIDMLEDWHGNGFMLVDIKPMDNEFEEVGPYQPPAAVPVAVHAHDAILDRLYIVSSDAGSASAVVPSEDLRMWDVVPAQGMPSLVEAITPDDAKQIMRNFQAQPISTAIKRFKTEGGQSFRYLTDEIPF